METKHTPGPWKARATEKAWHVDGGTYASSAYRMRPHKICTLATEVTGQEANARRLVACWNACLGIDDPEAYLAAAHRLTQRHDLREFEEIEAERDAMQSRAEAAESDMAAAERGRAELLRMLGNCAAALTHCMAVMPHDDPLYPKVEVTDRSARAAIAKANAVVEQSEAD